MRDGHIRNRSPESLALYLFLCIVADAQGASYYSDTAAGKILSFSSVQLRAARTELVTAGLIAYRSPFYQILSLEPKPAVSIVRAPEPRLGEVRSVGEILRAMMEVPQ